LPHLSSPVHDIDGGDSTPVLFVQKHFHKLKRRVSGIAQNAKHMTVPKMSCRQTKTPLLVHRKKAVLVPHLFDLNVRLHES